VDGKELTTRVVSPSVACQLLGQSVKAIVSTVERETRGSNIIPFRASQTDCLPRLVSLPLVQV